MYSKCQRLFETLKVPCFRSTETTLGNYLFNPTKRFFNTKHTKRRNTRKMLIVDVRVFRVFCVEKHAGIVSVELSM